MVEFHGITVTPVPAANNNSQGPVLMLPGPSEDGSFIAVRIAATGEEQPVYILNWSDSRLPLWAGVTSPTAR
jgi:hypothetical protein